MRATSLSMAARAGTEWVEDEDRGLGAVDVLLTTMAEGRVQLPCGAGSRRAG